MDAPLLRDALVARFDQKITPEVAAEIYACVTGSMARPIDLSQFDPLAYQGYVIHAERLSDIIDEIHPLHAAHYAETELHSAGIPMRPDYDAMLMDEQMGRLLQFTCRKDGALVGNLRMYVGLSRHTKTLLAEEDTLYLDPAHRGGFLAVQMLRYAEGRIKRLGVREIYANSKLVNKADVLMRRMKYRPTAMQFTKIIEAHTDV